MENVAEFAKKTLGHRNVVGFSNYMMPKISYEKFAGHNAIRIYVTKKLPLRELRATDLVPSNINGIPTDIIEIGEIYAVPPVLNEGRRDVVRPLVSGISAGNWAITTGTLGIPARYDGDVYAMSNAHVFCDDPSKEKSTEKRIVQPGKYDGGTLDNIIGEYFWHSRIFPNGMMSDCPLGGLWTKIGNFGSKVAGARTKFKTYVEGDNYQDLGACKLREDMIFEITRTFDFDIFPKYALASRIFAGSDQASILCKLDYQLDAGFEPIVPYLVSSKLKVGDELRKSGRTTFDTTGTITDMSATLTVNYGNFYATMSDVIVTTNMCSGGDSGSDVWKEF